jgi:mRNA interferase RelE/StbE
MFEIQYHSKIPDDIARLSVSIKKDIQRGIEEKLTTSPEFFGKPLQFSLKGLRSMRVGDYRVIFQISGKVVRVVFIGHRSTVYTKVAKRI